MKIELERLFERTARDDERVAALRVAEDVLRGREGDLKRLAGRLSRYFRARINEHRYLVMRVGPGVVKVVAVCSRYSVKYEAMHRKV